MNHTLGKKQWLLLAGAGLLTLTTCVTTVEQAPISLDPNLKYAHGYANLEATACERAHENAAFFAGSCQLNPCQTISITDIPPDQSNWDNCNKRMPCYRATIVIDCPDVPF